MFHETIKIAAMLIVLSKRRHNVLMHSDIFSPQLFREAHDSDGEINTISIRDETPRGYETPRGDKTTINSRDDGGGSSGNLMTLDALIGKHKEEEPDLDTLGPIQSFMPSKSTPQIRQSEGTLKGSPTLDSNL